MSKYIWVRNPTAINGLATTYVSLRGSDTTGDGTAQNPYRSLAKATTVAAANTNIMMDDGKFSEERNRNNKKFIFWGNALTYLSVLSWYGTDHLNYIHYKGNPQYVLSNTNQVNALYIFNSIFINCELSAKYRVNYANYYIRDSIFINCNLQGDMGSYSNMEHSVFISCMLQQFNIRNCILYNCTINNYGTIAGGYAPNDYNNFCNKPIQNIDNQNSINDLSTGQTIADYFTHYDPANWENCDFTAKAGSANIGAGENGSTIGLNQGFAARATNDSNDIFSAANGATLRNIEWNAGLNGYSLVHKDKLCAGYTVNTITLAADAEAIDDYYNGLFIGITAGDGAGEIHRIVDYDGATRVATIDTSWYSAISTSSIYSISGTIDSATKDFGKVIKVKRNWAFLANMQSWTDPNNSGYGMWKEFITTPLQNNGVWELRPCSNFRYEYSLNGTDWNSNTELIAGTDTDNKTDSGMYGNASESYVPGNAKTTILRYIRYHIEIGFNVGEDAQ